ncbi:MAG: zinc-ribbon domain-containing protein [Dehalococcoidia bacterium]|nr:zinc-ribbon domain-containing protein [Dehalococcoidia bacterium]
MEKVELFCSKCGSQQSDNAQFCINCGAKISNNQGSFSYQPQPVSYQQPQAQSGDSAANIALVCGIVGLLFFFLGSILGTIAIIQASKAKGLGYIGIKVTIGLVLGIIAVIVGVIWLLLVLGTCAISLSNCSISTDIQVAHSVCYCYLLTHMG